MNRVRVWCGRRESNPYGGVCLGSVVPLGTQVRCVCQFRHYRVEVAGAVASPEPGGVVV